MLIKCRRPREMGMDRRTALIAHAPPRLNIEGRIQRVLWSVSKYISSKRVNEPRPPRPYSTNGGGLGGWPPSILLTDDNRVGARARHAYLSVSCSKLGKVPHRGQSPPGRKVLLFVL